MPSLKVPTIPYTQLSDPSTQSILLSTLRTHGFFLLSNHPIGSSLIQKTFTKSEKFFSLPSSTKASCSDTLCYGQSNRGYQVIGGQILGHESGQTSRDLKEAFQIGFEKDPDHEDVLRKRMLCGPNIWPCGEGVDDEEVRGMKGVFEEYLDEAHGVAGEVMRVLGGVLGVSGDEKIKSVWEGYCMDIVGSIRLLHYPPAKGLDEMGAGAHTDFGAITLLMTDDTPGLQVLHEGIWHDIEPQPGTFIVNVGDGLQLLTGGYFKSSVHRVVNTSGKDRYSIPFFYDGNLDTVLKPIVTKDGKLLVGGRNEESEWRTVEEHLKERLGSSRSDGKVN